MAEAPLCSMVRGGECESRRRVSLHVLGWLAMALAMVLAAVMPSCHALRPDWAPARELQVIDAANLLSVEIGRLAGLSSGEPGAAEAVAKRAEVQWMIEHEVSRARLRPGNRAGVRQWELLQGMVGRYCAAWEKHGPAPADVAAIFTEQASAALQSIKRLEFSRRAAK